MFAIIWVNDLKMNIYYSEKCRKKSMRILLFRGTFEYFQLIEEENCTDNLLKALTFFDKLTKKYGNLQERDFRREVYPHQIKLLEG